MSSRYYKFLADRKGLNDEQILETRRKREELSRTLDDKNYEVNKNIPLKI